jgi:hypothetical protein
MSTCRWWSDKCHKCVHPDAPQKGECDWIDEFCPYDEQITEEEARMYCPYCKERLEMYERLIDFDDCETLIGVEHYSCPQCNHTYSRDVTYELVKEGALEE